jgi:hypothetical protein
MARALMMVVSSSTDEERIVEFNDWYAEHVQELLQVEGIVSATRWEASPHQLLPGAGGIEGRRFLALYEIECDDVEAVRNRIRDTSPKRSHSDLLQLDPLPITLLFEHLGEWNA